jgi:ADP-ribose pyrophosphatase YjhB (NUDIX family)
MGVRSCAKAIVVSDGKLLLNQCVDDDNGEYYALPGGGQNPYETLEEAVVRECLEETGYQVFPTRFAALYEEIFDVPEIRERYPDYAHRVYHLFVCELSGGGVGAPTETDVMQTGSEWIEIPRLSAVRLLPEAVGANLQRILDADAPVYLGSGHAVRNHG